MKTKAQRAARRKRIKSWVKNMIGKIVAFVKKLDKVILPEITDAGIKFMQGFKKAVNSGVIDFVTDFTHSDADDVLVEKIRLAAEHVISGLEAAKQCQAKETLEERILCYAAIFKGLSKKEQGDILNSIHADFLAAMDGDKLTRTEYMLTGLASHLAEKTA